MLKKFGLPPAIVMPANDGCTPFFPVPLMCPLSGPLTLCFKIVAITSDMPVDICLSSASLNLAPERNASKFCFGTLSIPPHVSTRASYCFTLQPTDPKPNLNLDVSGKSSKILPYFDRLANASAGLFFK